MARTTVSNTIQRIRRQLSSSFRYEINTLGVALGPADVQVVLSYELTAGVIVGGVLSIGVETMRIMGVDRPSKTVTVLRGWQDSDGASHVVGDEVWINPRFNAQDIYDAMIDEVLSWGPLLYKVEGIQVPITESAQTIELPLQFTGCYGLIRVLRNWSDLGQTAWPELNFRFQRSPTAWTGSSSGMLIRALDVVSVGNLLIICAMPFITAAAELPTTADLVTDVGIPESLLDVLGMGVKIRVLGDSWMNRSSRSAQDEPRTSEETPIDGGAQTYQLLVSQYRQRLNAEKAKLNTAYPIRFA